MSTSDYNYYQKLIATAQAAAAAYYDTEAEIMSDLAYDTLIDEIEELSVKNGWTDADSLLNVVAAGQSNGGDINHKNPMLSLAKANNTAALNSFLSQVGDNKLVLEPKLDGLALSVLYKNGVLTQVAIRGDGTSGEDVTSRLGTVAGLPKTISYKKELEVRGEVFITEDNFVTANKNRLAFEYDKWATRNPTVKKVPFEVVYAAAVERKPKNLDTPYLSGKTDFFPEKLIFSNPRNAVAGSLRRETTAYVVPMTFACYEVYPENSNEMGDSYLEQVHFVETLGVKTAYSLIPLSIQLNTNVIKAVEAFGDIRKKGLAYPTDGVVLKVDSLKERKRLGAGSKSPKWAIAYKYPSLTTTTVVNDVELAIGRTGRLSLRAKIEPIFLEGTLISYVSLHNVSWLEERDIRIGDTVVLSRANDVIPYISQAIVAMRPATAKRWVAPAVCPKCGENWDKRTLLWRCESPLCGELSGIIFAAGRDYFDWEGLSEAIITRLNDLGLVNDVADVFSLTEKQLTNLVVAKKDINGNYIAKKDGSLEVLGVNGAKIYAQIQKSKKRPLAAVLAALGVRTLGRTFGRRLEAYYGDMGKIIKASPEELTNVEGIAIKKAEIIHAGLKEKLPVIAKLAQQGVTMTAEVKKVKNSNPFVGKKIVVTGSIPGYTRGQAQELMTEIGAVASSSVSSSTDFLVADESSKGSSKYQKALSLAGKVQIITPAKFLAMLGK